MALRSKEWFYKVCLSEVKQYSRLAHLCWDLLEKGIGQKDSTRGHVTQAIGATQEFLRKFPDHREAILKADPTRPFDIAADPQMLADFLGWIASKRGKYGRKSFGYNYSTLKSVLTRSLGGRTTGGGGGDDEFKRVLRLIAEFVI